MSSSGVRCPQGAEPGCNWNNRTPLLSTHYRCLIARMGRSVLETCVGILCLAFRRLAGSLGIMFRVPSVPLKRPNRTRALYMPDITHPVSRLPIGSSWRFMRSPVFMSALNFDTSTRVRDHSPSLFTPDAPLGYAFSPDAHDHGLQPRPLEGGLEPTHAGVGSGGSVPPSLRQLLVLPGQLRANQSRIAAAYV